MNIEVPNKVFRIFFDLLWQKFSVDALKDQKIAPHKKEDIWKVRSPKTNNYLTSDLFDTNWDYFRKRNSEARIESGVVLVNPKCFSKAVIYLDVLSKSQTNFDQVLNEEQQAKLLLDQLRIYINNKYDSFESSEITDLTKLPEFRICSKVCIQFFTFINEEKFLDAWHLLSPNCQKDIFAEKFEIFETRFLNFQSFTQITFWDLWITRKKVDFRIHFWENRIIYDLKKILLLSKKSKGEGSVEAKQVTKSIEHCLALAGFKSLEKLDRKLMEDFKFQKWILSISPRSLLLKRITSKPKFVSEFSNTNIVLAYLAGRWLIEDIEGFNPTFNNFSDSYLV